ncbi:hypothetical protein IHE44_0013537 [Lamprotornis superbus]|uniref:ERO1-like protein alpha n=1 Tax=Lamprotornis superbus TaxID=245042 RepID=A0A835NNG0_9PASS|nr:hypothetical protein IHE44_0013537 [Lamprotornis superbus]
MARVLRVTLRLISPINWYLESSKARPPSSPKDFGIICSASLWVTGYLDDCTCDVETIDAFNNYKLFPRLNELLESDYFRYYKDCWCGNKQVQSMDFSWKTEEWKLGLAALGDVLLNRVNLQKPCPFWDDNSHCGMRDCAVQPCPSYSEEANNLAEECEEAKRLGAVDDSLSKETREAVLQWAQHDDSSDSFYIHSPEAEYVDLLLNPERYTGYKGPDAWKIWNSIYEENCFKPQNVKRPLASGREDDGGHMFYKWLKGVCVEKRAFYRLISGLHASINIHLSARYLLQDTWSEKKWGPNITEFQQRFDEVITRGEGPRRLKNLYFLYLIELRALSKVLPFFERPGFQLYTGNKSQDAEMKHLLLEILHLAKSFPLHFDENSFFAGNKKEAAKLKEEFRLHFKNISKIMDCVGCFKCRLWGKLQVRFVSRALVLGLVLGYQSAPGQSSGLLIPYLCRQQEAADSSLLSLKTGIIQERGGGAEPGLSEILLPCLDDVAQVEGGWNAAVQGSFLIPAQTQGLGTALKILFSENLIEKIPESGPSYGFQLTRQEIVALFNAFGRVSTSVKELENFRNILQNRR